MCPDRLERVLRERLDALGPAPRAELLHVLMLPDFQRADRIGEFWSYPESRTFDELLIELRGGPDAPGGADCGGWGSVGLSHCRPAIRKGPGFHHGSNRSISSLIAHSAPARTESSLANPSTLERARPTPTSDPAPQIASSSPIDRFANATQGAS
jgi:hypothetical protein